MVELSVQFVEGRWWRWVPRFFLNRASSPIDEYRMDDGAEPSAVGDGSLGSPEESAVHTIELQQRARRLADRQRVVVQSHRSHRLRSRLLENGRVLEQAHRGLVGRAADEANRNEATAWFCGNYRFIEDQMRGAKRDLPRKYTARLPTLSEGRHAGLPRVYEVALELVTYCDGRVDQAALQDFVAAYQEVAQLTLGELWAMPAMFRLAAIETLRGVAVRVARRYREVERGQWWGEELIDSMTASTSLASRGIDEWLDRMLGRERPVTNGFLVGFHRRVEGTSYHQLAVARLSRFLSDRGMTIDAQLVAHGQEEELDARAVRAAVLSLRALGNVDWKQFVEETSTVENVLRQDPTDAYRRMDFASRDYYRHQIETLAQRSGWSEEQVARQAVALAARKRDANGFAEPVSPGEQPVEAHVGYYLIDRGRVELEQTIANASTWHDRLSRLVARAPLTCYLGGIAVIWVSTITLAARLAWDFGVVASVGALGSVVILCLFAGAASEFAIRVVNWLCTLVVPPRPMMRLDFSAGIASEYRTLVAVPTMLTSEAAVQSLVRQLELRYVANRDENLLFALLTDLPDASQEVLPSDTALITKVQREIDQLNRRYGVGGAAPFFLLHRSRKWSAQQDAWMGEERKCGKLAALNRLILTGSHDAFSHTTGDLQRLSTVRFVITLDTDTQLPPRVGRELAGCLAHPLNRPQIDPKTRIIVRGHGIVQPRVGATIPEAYRSIYSRIWTGDAGIDPYTRQISEVYHDLFGRGSYIGKGIYDVPAFAASLGGRFPANRILSHDLIEGCFARSGLVNDVQVFEGFPPTLLGEMARRHRWIRGDWQIASWIRSHVPTANGWAVNPLDALSRWKIFDNMRRSLVPIFLFAFLLTGWALAPAWSGYWALLATGIALGPALIGVLFAFWRKPEEKPWRLHWRDYFRTSGRVLSVEIISLCVLPYTAQVHCDAIARALYRLKISGKKLLEWSIVADPGAPSGKELRTYYVAMWSCVLASAAVAVGMASLRPQTLLLIGPLLVLWLAAPAIAWYLSERKLRAVLRRTETETAAFRRWARQTWHYFETNVTEADHWLPPDNVQDCPHKMVAHRTSPTNIGMKLLADLAAYDLGYLASSALLETAGKTLQTMATMERYRGHFYNWYDTVTLKPIEARYISSVDSGNLGAALLCLQAGLEELRHQSWIPSRLFPGLYDTLEVIASLRTATNRASCDRFTAHLRQLQTECRVGAHSVSSSTSASSICGLLCRIRSHAAALAAVAEGEPATVREWIRTFIRQCAEMHSHISGLTFWNGFSAFANRCGVCTNTAADGRDHCRCVRRAGRERRIHSANGKSFAYNATERAMAEIAAEIEWLDRGCSLQDLAATSQRIADRVANIVNAISTSGNDRSASGNGTPASGFNGRVVAFSNGREGAERRRKMWLSALHRAAERSARRAREQLGRIERLAELARQTAEMDFRLLYHPQRKLLAVGFSVARQCRDDSHYDLLASEARLTSFLAISDGQLPLEHWFALGRSVALVDGAPALVSWSGSMFEYLMPMLLLPSYPGTVLDISCRTAIRRQMRYAMKQSIPWGISESCYSATDAEFAYCYKAFGVPGLGFDREADESCVVAPYATALAAMVTPREAYRNLLHLERMGALSSSGFYDALDYSPGRNLLKPTPCRTVMAHHSGMTLAALTNVLLDGRMQQRFLKSPIIAAHSVLLQERLPQAVRPVASVYLSSERPVPIGRTAVVPAAEAPARQATAALRPPAALLKGVQGSQ